MPESEFEIRHVGVAGGGYFDEFLSEGVIAFEGSVDDGNRSTLRPLYFHSVAKGMTVSTGVFGDIRCFAYPYMVIAQQEQDGADFNGDGDLSDTVTVSYNVVTEEVVRIVDYGYPKARVDWPCVSSGRVAYSKAEYPAGEDLNGDGDLLDNVVYTYDIQNRTEALVGLGIRPVMREGHMAWECPAVGVWDLCLLELASGRQWSAGISSRYPGARGNPYTLGVGSGYFAFSIDEGGESLPHNDVNGDGRYGQDWMALLSRDRGDFELLNIGPISPTLLRFSDGRILAYSGYNPGGFQGVFVYDVTSRVKEELPGFSLGYLQFHGKVIVGLRGSLIGIPEAPPPPLPEVVLYSWSTGLERPTGFHGILSEFLDNFDGATVVVTTNETELGRDLNRDGDKDDTVPAYLTTLRLERGPPDLIPLLSLGLMAAVAVGSIVARKKRELKKRGTQAQRRLSGASDPENGMNLHPRT